MKITVNRDSKKVRYSKKIVLFCIVAVTALFIFNCILAYRAGEQIDPVTIGEAIAFYGGELFAAAWVQVTKTKQALSASERAQDEP